MVVTAQQIAAFLSLGDQPDVVATAAEHLPIVIALARSYTRDKGFDPVTGEPADDLGAVLVTACARTVENPAQDRRYSLGAEDTTHTPFLGWSLAETFVLNRYRKRAM